MLRRRTLGLQYFRQRSPTKGISFSSSRGEEPHHDVFLPRLQACRFQSPVKVGQEFLKRISKANFPKRRFLSEHY